MNAAAQLMLTDGSGDAAPQCPSHMLEYMPKAPYCFIIHMAFVCKLHFNNRLIFYHSTPLLIERLVTQFLVQYAKIGSSITPIMCALKTDVYYVTVA